jgi:hypothetical protein
MGRFMDSLAVVCVLFFLVTVMVIVLSITGVLYAWGIMKEVLYESHNSLGPQDEF